MEDWQIRGVTEGQVKVVSVSRLWSFALRKSGFDVRVVDIGAPALCEVAILSVVEARRVNDAFLANARAELAEMDAARKSPNVRFLYEGALRDGASVAALLDSLIQESYYPNWVVLESMNID
jgi:hypothetical protein